MGSLNNSYRKICFESYCLFYDNAKINQNISLEEIEKILQNMEHDNKFYYKCGVAAEKVFNEILQTEGCDTINASIGGLDMFENLIGLNDVW